VEAEDVEQDFVLNPVQRKWLTIDGSENISVV
jgi:hypothetical protein